MFTNFKDWYNANATAIANLKTQLSPLSHDGQDAYWANVRELKATQTLQSDVLREVSLQLGMIDPDDDDA